VLRQKGPTARSEGGGGQRCEKESMVEIGSSLHADCHYIIIFRHRHASPPNVFPHELIPYVRTLCSDTAASHTRVPSAVLFLLINYYTIVSTCFLLFPQKIDDYFIFFIFKNKIKYIV